MIAPVPLYPSTSRAPGRHCISCSASTPSQLDRTLSKSLQLHHWPFEFEDASSSQLTHRYNEQELRNKYLSAAHDPSTAQLFSPQVTTSRSDVPARHPYPDFLTPIHSSPAPLWHELLHHPVQPTAPADVSPEYDLVPLCSGSPYYSHPAFQGFGTDASLSQDPLRELDELLLDIHSFSVSPSTDFTRPEDLPPPPISRTLSRPSSSPYPVRPDAVHPQAPSRSPPSEPSTRSPSEPSSRRRPSRRRPSHLHPSSGRTSRASSPPAQSPILADEWACPRCPYYQHNRRKPDLRRHIAIHRDTTSTQRARWTCCGVPLSDVAKHGVPKRVLRQQPMVIHEGIAMVGGCTKTFSRKDALQRHLRVRKGVCFGDACAGWHPGNRARDVRRS